MIKKQVENFEEDIIDYADYALKQGLKGEVQDFVDFISFYEKIPVHNTTRYDAWKKEWFSLKDLFGYDYRVPEECWRFFHLKGAVRNLTYDYKYEEYGPVVSNSGDRAYHDEYCVYSYDFDKKEFLKLIYGKQSIRPIIHSLDKINEKNCKLSKEDVEKLQEFLKSQPDQLEEERVAYTIAFQKGEISKKKFDNFVEDYKICAQKRETMVEDWVKRSAEIQYKSNLLDVKNKKMEHKRANRQKVAKALKNGVVSVVRTPSVLSGKVLEGIGALHRESKERRELRKREREIKRNEKARIEEEKRISHINNIFD